MNQKLKKLCDYVKDRIRAGMDARIEIEALMRECFRDEDVFAKEYMTETSSLYEEGHIKLAPLSDGRYIPKA